MNITAVQAVEESEYGRAKTSVWWDIENCAVPKGCDAHGIALKLSSALMKMNYCGPLSISSYGNTNLIPNSIQKALSSTGIDLNHVPSGKKNASDKKILVDMLLWVVENPPPANIMLISGDGDFSDALHRLRMRRYNILLAHPQQASPSLVASAKTTWLWGNLLPAGCPLTQCESSRLFDNESYPSDFDISSQGSSEQVFSKQSMASESKASNQLMQQDTRRKKLQMDCTETGESAWFCNVACKSFELLTMYLLGKEHAAQWELKQNYKLLGEPENMVARPSECHEKDVEMTNKMVGAGVETSSCSVCPSQTAFDSHPKNAAIVKAEEALFDVKNIEENVQDNDDLQSRDAQESMKCLEEQNKELVETCTTSESSSRELRQVFKERLESEGGAPLDIDCFFSELSRDFRVPKELRECFEAILKKLEPSINEIVIEEGMPKQGLEMKSGEPLTEHLEDTNKKKKRKKKKSGVIEDKTETYVCSICSVMCHCPTAFGFHLNGRKHAAKIKKHTEALLDGKQIEEEIIQDNDHAKEIIEEIRFQPGEAHEYIVCLEKQNKELGENEEVPNEECIFTELNSEFSAPQEAREAVDDIIKKLELSQDATLTLELESKAKQSLEMDSNNPESNSAGATEYPKDKKKKNDKVTKEEYVCSICSVICDCPIVFESHLMGRRHAARVKKHGEVLVDDKKILEESLKEKDHPIDTLQEVRFQPEEVQESSIKEVCQIAKEGLENDSEAKAKSTVGEAVSTDTRSSPKKSLVFDSEETIPRGLHPENSGLIPSHITKDKSKSWYEMTLEEEEEEQMFTEENQGILLSGRLAAGTNRTISVENPLPEDAMDRDPPIERVPIDPMEEDDLLDKDDFDDDLQIDEGLEGEWDDEEEDQPEEEAPIEENPLEVPVNEAQLAPMDEDPPEPETETETSTAFKNLAVIAGISLSGLPQRGPPP